MKSDNKLESGNELNLTEFYIYSRDGTEMSNTNPRMLIVSAKYPKFNAYWVSPCRELEEITIKSPTTKSSKDINQERNEKLKVFGAIHVNPKPNPAQLNIFDT